jgi:hypothetical protein
MADETSLEVGIEGHGFRETASDVATLNAKVIELRDNLQSVSSSWQEAINNSKRWRAEMKEAREQLPAGNDATKPIRDRAAHSFDALNDMFDKYRANGSFPPPGGAAGGGGNGNRGSNGGVLPPPDRPNGNERPPPDPPNENGIRADWLARQNALRGHWNRTINAVQEKRNNGAWLPGYVHKPAFESAQSFLQNEYQDKIDKFNSHWMSGEEFQKNKEQRLKSAIRESLNRSQRMTSQIAYVRDGAELDKLYEKIDAESAYLKDKKAEWDDFSSEKRESDAARATEQRANAQALFTRSRDSVQDFMPKSAFKKYEETRLQSAINGSFGRLQSMRDHLPYAKDGAELDKLAAKMDAESEYLKNKKAEWDQTHPKAQGAAKWIKELGNEIEGLGKAASISARILNAGIGGFKAYSGYSQQAARVIGKFNPFSMWSYPETIMGLQQAKYGFWDNIGGKASGLGAGLIATGNPIGIGAGAIASLGGAGMSLFGTMNKMWLANWQSALSVVKTISGGIVGGLKTLLDGAKFVAGGLLTLARNIIGGFTGLFGLGSGLLAAGAALGANTVNKTFGQNVNWNNQNFTGISLREQIRNEHYEDYWYLGRGTLQKEILNYNRTLAKFQTEGVFENQLPAALSGMIPFVTNGRNGLEGIMDMVNYIAKVRTQENFPKIENWFNEQGLDIVTHIAGQVLEGRGPERPWWQYNNQENAERNFRSNKAEFDGIRSGIQYIFKDISNTLWAKKIPFANVTGREIAVNFGNLLGAIPPALQGNMKPLMGGLGYFAGLGLRTVDNAGKAFDEKTGLGLWNKTKGLASTVAERGLGLANIGLEAVKTGNWTPLWDYLGEQAKNIADSAGGMIKGLFDNGKTVLGSLWDWIAGKVKGFFNSDFPDTLMRGFHQFSTWMNKTLTGIFQNIDTGSIAKYLSGLGYELFRAFKPGIKFIAGALYEAVSRVVEMIAYMKKNPFGTWNPYTKERDYFITPDVAKQYKKIENVINEGFVTSSFDKKATSLENAFKNKGLENPLYTKDYITNYNEVLEMTGDVETAMFAQNLSMWAHESRLSKDNLKTFLNEAGVGLLNFYTKGDKKQKEILDRRDKKDWLGAWHDYATGGNTAERVVEGMFSGVEKWARENGYTDYDKQLAHQNGQNFDKDRTAEWYAPIETPAPKPVVGEDAALGGVIASLQQTIRDLQAQVKALAEKQGVPLTAVLELKDENGKHTSVTLTQEGVAALFGASAAYTYTFKNAGAR